MSSQPIHVLCVDDDVHVLSFVGATLRDAGCDVETALDGAHALQLIATSHRDFDVMIVDVRMPNLDGWRFIVAARGAGYRGKVIVFSAFFDGVGAGGDGVLLLLIADGDRAFDALHDRRFNVSRLADLAGGQQQNAK